MLRAVIDKTLDPYFLRFLNHNWPTERGEALLFEDIVRVTGIDNPDRMRSRINRHYMNNHGILIKKRGQMFYLLTAVEQMQEPRRGVTIAGRSLVRGRIRGEAIKPLELGEKDRHRLELILDVIARLQAACAGGKKEIAALEGTKPRVGIRG